jgi:hypothetical protein
MLDSTAQSRNGGLLLQTIDSENNTEINKQALYQPIKTFYTIVDEAHLPLSSSSGYRMVKHFGSTIVLRVWIWIAGGAQLFGNGFVDCITPSPRISVLPKEESQ